MKNRFNILFVFVTILILSSCSNIPDDADKESTAGTGSALEMVDAVETLEKSDKVDSATTDTTNHTKTVE